jgi:toxin ParE1/3/4
MAYRLSGQAEEDIINLYVHGALQFGTHQADRYHIGLHRTFETIAANPHVSHERPEFEPQVRIHPFGSHVIIYQVIDKDDVLILRIRCGREDWANDPN